MIDARHMVERDLESAINTAIRAGMTGMEFIAFARELWADCMREKARADDKQFANARSNDETR